MITERIQQLQRAAAAALDSRKLTAGSAAAASAGLLGGHISARSATAGTAGSPARMQVRTCYNAVIAILHAPRRQGQHYPDRDVMSETTMGM